MRRLPDVSSGSIEKVADVPSLRNNRNLGDGILEIELLAQVPKIIFFNSIGRGRRLLKTRTDRPQHFQ
jgi:hypothetical protein